MKKNSAGKQHDELPQVPTNRSEDVGSETEQPQQQADLWSRLKWLKARGFYKAEIEEYDKPYYNLNKGPHYFVLDNPSQRSIKCLSCPVAHGGRLEAHLLTRYTIKDGVLSLDGRAVNTTPENYFPPA